MMGERTIPAPGSDLHYAKFVGDPEKVNGMFVRGGLYLATSYLVGGAENEDSFLAVDAVGEGSHFRYDDGVFVFGDEVFAVATCVLGEIEPGEVVGVGGGLWEEDGIRLELLGYGLYRAECFRVLDVSLLFPGAWLMDAVTGRWFELSRVWEDWSVSTKADVELQRRPTEFRVCLVNGEPMPGCPTVKCLRSGDGLDAGGTYWVSRTPRGEGMVTIEIGDDDVTFPVERFELLFDSPFRDEGPVEQ